MNYNIMRGIDHIIIIVGNEAVIISKNNSYWLPRQSEKQAKTPFGTLNEVEIVDGSSPPIEAAVNNHSTLQFNFSSGITLQVRYTNSGRLEFNLFHEGATLPFAAAHIPITMR